MFGTIFVCESVAQCRKTLMGYFKFLQQFEGYTSDGSQMHNKKMRSGDQN